MTARRGPGRPRAADPMMSRRYRLPRSLLGRLAAVLDRGETPSAFMRALVEAEVARRERDRQS